MMRKVVLRGCSKTGLSLFIWEIVRYGCIVAYGMKCKF